MRTGRAAVAGGLLLLACGDRGRAHAVPSTTGSGSSGIVAAPPSSAAVAGEELRIRALLGAELERNSAAILEEDLSHRSAPVRRAAARAAARIADARSATLVARAITDEDLEVVAWAAHGLGATCAGRERETVRRLVARSASLGPTPPSPTRTSLPGAAEPQRAIATALARCGTREAEVTLRAWLQGPSPRAELGAVGLGQLAFRRNRLDDASLVALLDAAARTEQPVVHALLAFSYLDGLADSVRDRLVGVAASALEGEGTRRSLAIRALGQGGGSAVKPLAGVLGDAAAAPADRAEAARQLGRLGEAGQAALGAALAPLVPAVADAGSLIGPGWAPLAATLEGLEAPAGAARDPLAKLAELPLPPEATPAVRRRIVWLRCAAAAILAGEATLSQRLVACDPDPQGRAGSLATLRVLDRGRITGARLRRWRELAAAADPVVSETAIGLMARHPEIPRPHEVLVRALASERPGVVAAAAKILAAFPDRAAITPTDDRADADRRLATAEAPKPESAIVSGLSAALARPLAKGTLEPRLSLLDATGALAVLSLKPALEASCTSDQTALRSHAERALRRLGDRRRTCEGPAAGTAVSPIHPPTVGGFELVLHTDAGRLRLTLDAAQAPFAVARVIELARSRFYDGTVIHRAVPGFVVQFGDPGGDGYGGSDLGPLRCETGTLPFDVGSVGMALSGKDTGSSQLFVTLGSYPHLEGDYTRIGVATGDWNHVVAGDVIQRVEVRPLGAP